MREAFESPILRNRSNFDYQLKAVKMRLKGLAVRDWMEWGTYGKDGNEPLHFVKLKNMSDEHIKAILYTQRHISDFYQKQFKKELRRRANNPKLSRRETL